jgi:hypothetical protein
MVKPAEKVNGESVVFCREKKRLQDNFLATARRLNSLLNQQLQAVIEGDPDFSRFDLLLHMAQEEKEMAKYAWIGHVDSHQCMEGEAADGTYACRKGAA